MLLRSMHDSPVMRCLPNARNRLHIHGLGHGLHVTGICPGVLLNVLHHAPMPSPTDELLTILVLNCRQSRLSIAERFPSGEDTSVKQTGACTQYSQHYARRSAHCTGASL